jgi:hypothetical protein
MILTYTYGGINRSFSGHLRLSVIFYYPANGNRSLARIIEVLMYLGRTLIRPWPHPALCIPSFVRRPTSHQPRVGNTDSIISIQTMLRVLWSKHFYPQITVIKFIFQLFTLWTWLPVRITMYQPVLLYTTEEHGCSLTTFYVRVEHHEPTLLMIKTCNNEVWRMCLLLDIPNSK